jgi:hypothetical protein
VTLEDWAYVSEIAGSLAVVGSLVYLALQVRHSNLLSRAQARQSMMELTQDQLLLQVTDPKIWIGVFSNEPRSLEEKVKVNMWLTLFMRQREYEWFTSGEGIVDPKMYHAYAGVIAMILGTERNRRWWALRKDIKEFDSGFMSYVDQILARSPLTNYAELIKKWE